MKKVITATLLCLFAAPVFAQAVCGQTTQIPRDAALVCWTNATQDVNGNPIPAPPAEGSLKTTRLQRAYHATPTTPCDFAATSEPLQTLNFTPDVGSQYFPSGLKVGRHCFRIRHINTKDQMSDWSQIVYKIVAPITIAKPSPPSSVYVTGSTTGSEPTSFVDEDDEINE